jgi:flavin reductase (DIM6/NTAB) family NADH-FMN oxidoreductase RutF
MRLIVADSSPVEVYHWLVGIVTPRPIGWVTTLDVEGRVNLAPFSFFNVFGSNPPVVVFSPTVRRDGTRKDTLANVQATGEFVLNAAVESLADAVNLTAAELPPGQSEVDLAGLTLVPSDRVKPPRVAESPAHLECRVRQVVPVGDGPLSANLVVGEVIAIHVDDAVIGPDGRVDPAKLRTIGRLGGDWYARSSDLFALKRPQL